MTLWHLLLTMTVISIARHLHLYQPLKNGLTDMGHNLHVAKKYEIEYSSSFGFNHKVAEFHNLLTSLDISYNGENWEDDAEVYKEDWKKGLEKLRSFKELDEGERKEIEEVLNELDEPVNEIISIMERLLLESDQTNEYMLLSFF